MAEPTTSSKLPFLELIRVVASQLIVWHHLAFYGPLSTVAYPLVPGALDWLYEYGRMAVQLFFVMGGFLTARGLARRETSPAPNLLQIARHRYWRVGFPYLATVVLAVLANAVAGSLMQHESVGAPPTVPQLLAHVFFLQHVLGYESLSAGIWYLEIDFQLVLLTALILAIAPRIGQIVKVRGFVVAHVMLWTLALTALFWVNRDSRYDIWGIYFFGSYFLGMMLEWALSKRVPAWLFASYLGLVVGAACFDWRPRLLVASGTALTIFVAGKTGVLARWPQSRVIDYLGRISFSLFLVHFPICLVVSACVTRLWPDSPELSLAGMFGAWFVSMLGAVAFHHGVEARFLRGPKRATVTTVATDS